MPKISCFKRTCKKGNEKGLLCVTEKDLTDTIHEYEDPAKDCKIGIPIINIESIDIIVEPMKIHYINGVMNIEAAR